MWKNEVYGEVYTEAELKEKEEKKIADAKKKRIGQGEIETEAEKKAREEKIADEKKKAEKSREVKVIKS
jgi:tellurite resistance protein